MTLNLFDLLLMILAALGAGYFFNGIRVRELALAAARKTCERDSVQFLDQSVSVRRVSLSRDDGGRWRIWREYRFEYSVDGVERRRGHVIMLGYRLQGVVMGQPTLH